MQTSRISAIDVIDGLIDEAVGRGASDIHIDPRQHALRVSLRIDGSLQELCTLPKHAHQEVIARIKVLCGLRSDEHQAAQDGRFRSRQGEQDVDVRVSIVPTYHGENAVLRLLTSYGAHHTIATLGFSVHDQAHITKALAHPSGMILSTGPTGSGKTTTLYALMSALRERGSIVTIEDPIEYAIDGITQIQVNARAGLTFAAGLRAVVRQDPNIIMVGEIRDHETANIAIHTALTGHLLLSTVHTTGAAATVPRLLDMGIDAYLVASTLSLAIGQRLVRVLCDACKIAAPLSSAAFKSLQSLQLSYPISQKEILYHAPGCDACAGSGYRGRTMLCEVMVPNDALRDAVMQKIPTHELQQLAIKHGMTTMLDDGFAKARAGITSPEEILRVVHD
jgi:type II secretory ATPase GspE/PulE/Tfp pilus assembly ATPase PilB-like protein